MPLVDAMNLALSEEQKSQLTEAQKKLFINRVGLLVDEYGEGVTPEMIQGVYELVTEHILPKGLEL